jgi:hypothetical protein
MASKAALVVLCTAVSPVYRCGDAVSVAFDPERCYFIAGGAQGARSVS